MKRMQLTAGMIVVAAFAISGVMAEQKDGKHEGRGGKGVASTPRAKIDRVSAMVAGIDLEGKTIKLVSSDGHKEHAITIKDTTPITKNARSIKFADLAEGDKLDVNVEEKDGSLFARSITVTGHGKLPETKKHEEGDPGVLKRKQN